MPDKRCLIKSCKQVTGRVFPIPSLEVVDEHVFKVWFENLDKGKSNFDRPYGICIRHFAGDKKIFLCDLKKCIVYIFSKYFRRCIYSRPWKQRQIWTTFKNYKFEERCYSYPISWQSRYKWPSPSRADKNSGM